MDVIYKCAGNPLREQTQYILVKTDRCLQNPTWIRCSFVLTFIPCRLDASEIIPRLHESTQSREIQKCRFKTELISISNPCVKLTGVSDHLQHALLSIRKKYRIKHFEQNLVTLYDTAAINPGYSGMSSTSRTREHNLTDLWFQLASDSTPYSTLDWRLNVLSWYFF